jgi:hypothetical protein
MRRKDVKITPTLRGNDEELTSVMSLALPTLSRIKKDDISGSV